MYLNNANAVKYPAPGSVVSVPTHIFFRHKGIVSDRMLGGKPMVISNSARAGGVAEEPWDVFSGGQAWNDEGHPGDLSSAQVILRARCAPKRPYQLIDWNCENFVAFCHGFKPSSTQVAVVALIAVAGVALLATRSG